MSANQKIINFVFWIIYTIITVWWSFSLLEVFKNATNLIVVVPIVGFQAGFIMFVTTVSVIKKLRT